MNLLYKAAGFCIGLWFDTKNIPRALAACENYFINPNKEYKECYLD